MESAIQEIITEISNRDIKDKLFADIATICSTKLTPEWILEQKTSKGNTQSSERNIIKKIKEEVLDVMGLTYDEAGSQQSKDFRNVGGIGLDIEVKKTDSTTIYFNDTCPNKNIYYIVLFTGKTYKNIKHTNIPPILLYINGNEFIEDSTWLEDFEAELNTLKNKYARGDNKKQLTGIMSVYPRPTYKADITKFIRRILK